MAGLCDHPFRFEIPERPPERTRFMQWVDAAGGFKGIRTLEAGGILGQATTQEPVNWFFSV